MLGLFRRKEKRRTSPKLSLSELQELCRRLVAHRNDSIGVALAVKFAEAYDHLEEDQRNDLFEELLERYSARPERIVAAARAYEQNPGVDTHLALAKAVEAPRQALFQAINLAPDGIRCLVQMREDLLRVSTPRRVRLRAVEQDLKRLLQSWFNRGFLTLQRIDWDSPASLLEKLISYEAVHQIQGWEDLRRRLEQDRRCFGFFHPSLPDEPLVFVEIALTDGIARDIQALILRDAEIKDPASADTAMFYSISNCQTGLQGISFGGFLIKQVVEELRGEFPHVATYSTLSPVPRFCTWLGQQCDERGEDPVAQNAAALHRALEHRPDWFQVNELSEALQAPLMSMCGHYLVRQQLDGLPVDPVAKFHLGNGASLQHMNWLADTSDKGLAQSAGMMVNYVYEPESMERNRDAYISQGRIAAAREIQQLADQAATQSPPSELFAAGPILEEPQ